MHNTNASATLSELVERSLNEAKTFTKNVLAKFFEHTKIKHPIMDYYNSQIVPYVVHKKRTAELLPGIKQSLLNVADFCKDGYDAESKSIGLTPAEAKRYYESAAKCDRWLKENPNIVREIDIMVPEFGDKLETLVVRCQSEKIVGFKDVKLLSYNLWKTTQTLGEWSIVLQADNEYTISEIARVCEYLRFKTTQYPTAGTFLAIQLIS